MPNIAYLTTANRYMVQLTGNYSYSFRKHARYYLRDYQKENMKTLFELDFSNNLNETYRNANILPLLRVYVKE